MLGVVASLTENCVCTCDGLPVVGGASDVRPEVGTGLCVSGMVAVKLTITVLPA